MAGFPSVAITQAPNWIAPLVYTPAGTVKGRVYLLHGLAGANTDYTAASLRALSTGLWSAGYQTVAVGELYDPNPFNANTQSSQSQTNFLADPSGATFRADVVALHQTTKAFVEKFYGPAPGGAKDILLGISWGGLMGALIMQSLPATVRAFVLHEPAICPPILTPEYFGDSDRTDNGCGTTSGSPVVTDAAITAADLGKSIGGSPTGIPATSYIGTVTPGVSFRLSSSPASQVDVNATATGTVNIPIGQMSSLLLPVAASTTPGWISAGSSDTRVGYFQTQLFAQAIQGVNPNVSFTTYAQAHTTTAGNITDILAWIAANVA